MAVDAELTDDEYSKDVSLASSSLVSNVAYFSLYFVSIKFSNKTDSDSFEMRQAKLKFIKIGPQKTKYSLILNFY